MQLPALFDWDVGNLEKCQKHGVTLDEIEALFRSGARSLPDVAHSHEEERLIATGRNNVGRPLFVIFTRRLVNGNWHVRPISARYMHPKEAKRYEQASQADHRPKDDDR